MLSLGRIIYGSFAAFLPSMTSRLQDVASAADPVLSGCLSRQGPASPSGPAPRLTDDNTATLCLRELWEKKIGRPDPLFFLFFSLSLSLLLSPLPKIVRGVLQSMIEGDSKREREREGNKGREEVKKDRLRGFSLMSPCVSDVNSCGLLNGGDSYQMTCCMFGEKKKKSSYAFMQQRLLRWSDEFVRKETAVSEQEAPASFFQSIRFLLLDN